MATTPRRNPPLVGLITDHEQKTMEILVAGKNGSLSLRIPTAGTRIVVCDPARGDLRYKAVCELSANGHLRGWFVAHKGKVRAEDTLVFFPARKGQKPLLTAERVKK